MLDNVDDSYSNNGVNKESEDYSPYIVNNDDFTLALFSVETGVIVWMMSLPHISSGSQYYRRVPCMMLITNVDCSMETLMHRFVEVNRYIALDLTLMNIMYT